jgi:hypothetical protein
VITKAQVERYQQFQGDLDKWIDSQKKARDECIAGPDWTLIDKAAQRLKLEKTGFASHEYREETKRVLRRTFTEDGAAALVKALSQPT